MRILIIFLTLLTTFLSVVPCCFDEEVCGDDQELFSYTTEGEHGDESELPCSPFYICGSCAGFTNTEEAPSVSEFHFPVSSANFSPFLLINSAGFRILPLKPPQTV